MNIIRDWFQQVGLALVPIVLLCCCGQAAAWGGDGHRVTGYIAEALLAPAARVRLNQLLPAVSLADVSTWLDEERQALRSQMRGSQKWHYDNLPVCGQAPAEAMCPRGDCALQQLSNFRQVLADPRQDRSDRAFAAKVVIHLVGDIHQPLHEADNGDAGGNGVSVTDGRRTSLNLHQVWDSELLKQMMRGTSVDRYAADLLQRYRGRVSELAHGGPAGWAAESHVYAVNVAYGRLPGFACGKPLGVEVLTPAYKQAAYPVVERQLVAAGVRLAAVLNQALGQ